MSNARRGRRLSRDAYRSLALFRLQLLRYLAFSEAAAAQSGLEPRQYQLLLMLQGLTPRGQASVSDIADWLQVRHHSAVGLIDRVTRRGMVERQQDPADGRRVLVTLTQSGREALADLALAHRDELRRLAPELIRALIRVVPHPANSSQRKRDTQWPTQALTSSLTD